MPWRFPSSIRHTTKNPSGFPLFAQTVAWVMVLRSLLQDGEARSSHQSHTLEIVGSNPTPAICRQLLDGMDFSPLFVAGTTAMCQPFKKFPKNKKGPLLWILRSRMSSTKYCPGT